ncbi:MAG: HlyD family type I secretion periplasmic adaptor subunit, partial [Hyphomicrobium sp.]
MSMPLTLPAAAMPAARKPVLDRGLISVRNYVGYGFLTVLALFGGMGGWAAMTDMAGAVIAGGTVVVAGNIKKVQHPT